ncbi:hypothetical protein HRI_000088400 [Hibiscus trionum]|uniref:Uncharacterized protein n=1 Tax=Hibiscus trionum TaxID=183268 RepID=A0A9W7LHD1_HIBTR|nr:hypothetical protein HRI_000088400 [Hibiscus trionum]
MASLERKQSELEEEVARGNNVDAKQKEIKRIRIKLWQHNRQVEREWYKKSRLRWLSYRDRNSRFFHLVASNRRRANSMTKLKIGDKIFSDIESLKDGVKRHFESKYNPRLRPLKVSRVEWDLRTLDSGASSKLE